MSDLVGKPEARFSCVAIHVVLLQIKQVNCHFGDSCVDVSPMGGNPDKEVLDYIIIFH